MTNLKLVPMQYPTRSFMPCLAQERTRELIYVAFEKLQLSPTDTGQVDELAGVAVDGAFTWVVPTVLRRPRTRKENRGLLISVETGYTVEKLDRIELIHLLQSAGTLLANGSTCIGGDAHGRILLQRVVSLRQLTSDTLAAEIICARHLKRLLVEAPQGSDQRPWQIQ